MPFSFRKIVFSLLAAAALFLAAPQGAAAATRLALVLGNGKYENAPELENPTNDAHDLAQALRGLGFDVIEQRDAGREAMVKAVRDFSDRLPGADLALFFYAGHGLQMSGENYLLPVDAKIQNPADVRFNTINLSDVQREMESGSRTNIMILDACRNNPFAEMLSQGGRAIGGRGLGRMEAAAQGSLIVYSTQPDNVALDGAGRNSPFTAALLKHLSTPGLEVRQMLSRVRGDVLAATDKRQTPWDSSSLVGDVYLASAPADQASQATAPAQAAAPPPAVSAPAAAEPARAPVVTAQTSPAAANAPDASAEPENECDKIAALRLQIPSVERTPKPQELDWLRAVPNCEAQVQAHPSEMRFVYELARAQDHTRNYPEALRNYKTVADSGFVEAMVDLGAMYYLGHGVLQSYPTAFDYFSRAAAVGSIRGLANLASMYNDGRGAPKDDAKSLDYAEKAVEAGNPFGLAIIASHYFNGTGVPRDYNMAAQYWRQAADLGDGKSLKFLANLYESGYLGPPNPAKAGELRLQAEQVDPGSSDPEPAHLPMLRQASASVGAGGGKVSYRYPRRRYVTYRYNPAWQAAPGDTRCCPNNMLVCPLGRHFCGH